jgi:hypothetical protein
MRKPRPALQEINESVKTFIEGQKKAKEETKTWTDTIKEYSAASKEAFGYVKQLITPSGELTMGFRSTGEAMGALGNIAGKIPGPWGLAASAILQTGGQIVEWIEGPLLAAQKRAREGFLRIATGVTTIRQEVSQIQMESIRTGMENIAELQQRRGTFLGTVEEGFLRPFGVTTGSRQQSEMNRVEARINSRERELNQLMTGPNRQLMERFNILQSTDRLLTRGQEMPLHIMQRRAMRSLHGRHGDIDTSVQLMQQAEAARIARTGLMSYEQAMERLAQTTGTLRTSLALMQAQMEKERTDAYLDSLGKVLDKTQAATENLGLTRNETAYRNLFSPSAEDEAGITRVRTELGGMYRELERLDEIRSRTGDSMTGQRQVIEGYIAEREAIMEVAEAYRIVIALAMRENEEAVSAHRNQTAAFTTLRQVDFLATQRDSLGTVIDMHREEAALDALRARGAPRYLIQLQEVELALQRELKTMVQAEQQWNHIVQHQVQQGISIAQRFTDPLSRLREEENSVQTAFSRGAITRDEATNSIQRLRLQYEGLNHAMQLTPAVAAGSVEAFDRIRAQQLSLRPLGSVDLAAPIGPAGVSSSEEIRERAGEIIGLLSDIRDGVRTDRAGVVGGVVGIVASAIRGS